MYATDRRAALIATLVGILMLFALSACGQPDQLTGATRPTSAAPTSVAAPSDGTAAPASGATSAPTDPADTDATSSATAAPTATGSTTAISDTNATPTPVGVDDTDPFTGTDDLTDTDELSGTVGVTTTGQLTVTQPVAVAIGDYFGVPAAEVMALHQDGLGFGEIARAYFLARELAADGDPSNDLTAAQILALHQAGQGWGQIVAQLGLPHGNSQRNLGLIMSGRKPHEDAAPEAAATTGDDAQDKEHGPPSVPPGQAKKDNDTPHGDGNGGNGNGGNSGHGNGGGNGGNGKGNGHGGGKHK